MKERQIAGILVLVSCIIPFTFGGGICFRKYFNHKIKPLSDNPLKFVSCKCPLFFLDTHYSVSLVYASPTEVVIGLI